MENTEIDYLNNIPEELKLLIFSYLDTFDIIHLEEVSSRLEHLTYDKKLISTIRFYKEYRCSLLILRKTLLHSLRQNVITSLNINCIYWVSRIELKKCLKLPKLESLYAVDTRLGLNDLVDLKLPHLHTLAITLSDTNFHLYPKLTILNNLRNLYIHFDVKMRLIYVITRFLDYCCHLEELWIFVKELSQCIMLLILRIDFPKLLKKSIYLSVCPIAK